MWKRIQLGHGIGLRNVHFGHLLEKGPSGVSWFEVISENFFEPGGRPWAVLDKVRAEVPIICHGVSLGIGNTAPLSEPYLKSLQALYERIEPAWVSDHLCWGGRQGHYGHDLWPLPYTEEALSHVVRKVDQLQERLGRQFMLENVSSYVTFCESTMPEWEFLSEIARRTDCGILLDVNNVYVSSKNHSFDAKKYIDAIPPEQVGQIHLAGHTDKGTHLLDTHVGPVPGPVWDLYLYTVERMGQVPALIEWDEDIPDYGTVVAESRKAAQLEREALRAA
ncbi:MAG: DUF692 domain-containing protein [Bdellovibrionota bacterium]